MGERNSAGVDCETGSKASADCRAAVAALAAARAAREDRTACRRAVLFLALITAAVFIGGRSIVGPMLEKAMARAGDTHRKGAIVFTMPDGTFCRHLAFDNKTAELTESTVLQCPEARPRGGAHATSGFAWGAH